MLAAHFPKARYASLICRIILSIFVIYARLVARQKRKVPKARQARLGAHIKTLVRIRLEPWVSSAIIKKRK